jgi:hypothetical protein
MNPEQRKLARHALGLPNDQRRSYRNRYFVSGGPNAALWAAMEAAGEAGSKANGPGDFYWLTRKGAELALEPSEALDREDFPAISAADGAKP